METDRHKPDVDSVASGSERMLRFPRTPADVESEVQNPDLEDHLAALRVTNSRQNSSTQAA